MPSVQQRLINRVEGSRSSSRGDGRLSLKYDDPICKICRHDKIVLDDKGGLLRVKNESVSFFIIKKVREAVTP